MIVSTIKHCSESHVVFMIGEYQMAHALNSPTNNCQLFSIAQFDGLLGANPSDIHSALRFAATAFDKRLVLLDVLVSNCNKVEKIMSAFGAELITSCRYESPGTNSELQIYIYDLGEIF